MMVLRGQLLRENVDLLTEEDHSAEAKKREDQNTQIKPRQYVVVWVHPESDTISLVHLDASNGRVPMNRSLTEVLDNIRDGHLTAAPLEAPHHTLVPDDEAHAKHHRVKAARWNAITELVCPQPDPLLFNPKTRGGCVDRHAKKVGKTRDQLYTYLYDYWTNGQNREALLPPYSRCGAPGVERITEPGAAKGPGRPKKPNKHTGVPTPPTYYMQEEDRENVRRSIYRWKKGKINQALRTVYEDMLSRHYVSHFLRSGGDSIPVILSEGRHPTFDQFLFYAKRVMSDEEWRKTRSGEKRYQADIAGNQGRATRGASGAGDVYLLDSSPSDVHATSSIDQSLRVGRPTIYLVIDLFTMLIAGIYLGLENPSWISARLALFHAFDGMANSLEKMGLGKLAPYFPAKGICGHVKVDKGSEFNGNKANGLIEGWGPTWENCRSRSPRQRAVGELFFNIMNKRLFHLLPGGIVPDNMQRRRLDSRLDACLTVSQIRAAAIHAAAHVNQFLLRPQDLSRGERENRVGPSPIDRWQYSIRYMTGHLKSPTSQDLHVHLLAPETVKVTADGIIHGHLRYTGPRAEKEAWTTKARNGGNFMLEARTDPSLTEWIWVRMPGETGPFEMCRLKSDSMEYADYYYEDVELVHERDEEVASQREHEKLQSSVALGANIQSMSEHAEDECKVANAGKSKKEQLSGMAENRQMERAIERDERAQDTADRFGVSVPVPPRPDVSVIDDEEAEIAARIRQIREEQVS